MAQDIKQRIVLEGEKEYSNALKAAQRNLKTLRSELKAETAELGNNATAAQKNEVKTKNLQKQIREQEKIVKAYTEALAEVREKYGDNEDAIARYEQKLNDARTALANMKNSLDSVGQSFNSVQAGAKQSVLETNALADSFGKISESADKMATKMEDIFKGVADVIGGTIGAVWGELMEIAAKSDSWMDLGAFLGASATDVQKWDRAMKAAGGDITTITSMVSKLKYGGKDDKVAEWFGISGENYTNDLEYVEAVLNKMAEDKQAMVDAGTWADAMGDIFGAKKVQEIDGILSDWDQILIGLKTFDVENGGVGINEDEIQTMADLYNQVGLLQEKWNAFKESVSTKIFGKLALDLTSNAQGALDALIAFMDADPEDEQAREDALKALEENLTAFFTRIGEAIGAAGEAMEKAAEQLQESDNGWVKLLGDLLEQLGKALQWMADEDNMNAIKTFFEVLIAIWAGAEMARAVSHLLALGNAFKTIKANKALTSALNNWGNGVNTTGTTGAGGAAGAGGAMSVSSLTASAMTVSTETVSQSTVANMVVQNMVGGNTTPGTQPTTPVVNNGGSGSNLTSGSGYTPLLMPGVNGGTGGNAGLQAGNSSTPLLTSGNGSEPIQLSPNEVLIDGQPTISTPDVSIGADTVMYGGTGMAAGYAIGEYYRIKAEGEAKIAESEQGISSLLDYYKINMDDPEIARQVHEIFNNPSGIMDSEREKHVNEQLAAIAANGGASDTASHEFKYERENTTEKLIELYEDAKEKVLNTMIDWAVDIVEFFDGSSNGVDADDLLNGTPGGGTFMRKEKSGLPASWWKEQSGTTEEGQRLNQLLGSLPRDIQNGMTNIKVVMDSETVGYLVAPVVSQQIARNAG